MSVHTYSVAREIDQNLLLNRKNMLKEDQKHLDSSRNADLKKCLQSIGDKKIKIK